MATNKPPKKIEEKINRLVKYYSDNKDIFERTSKVIYDLFVTHKSITPFLHSMKYRVKDPNHLKDKLRRKYNELKYNQKKFDITTSNLFDNINDLAGVRILHLHTEQMKFIDPIIHEILDEEQYKIIEPAVASTWDDEYRSFFEGLGMETRTTDSMYTSVHYIIELNNKHRTKCELQVRTLMEEVWGEVSHKIDYPEKTKSIACQEQLKVLARITSSGTRLVDSIFKSYDEHNQTMKQ